MSAALEIAGLVKKYPKFTLGPISFEVPRGSITGFIGRNGAGKTTTLKAIQNVIHRDGGEVRYFGLDMAENEGEIKKRTGFSSGAVAWYPRKKISLLLDVTKRFYDNWDEEACRKYLELFSIDTDKTPGELSEGMKVKLNLAVALSHRAEMLILDEPTSGLDPVSRAEILEIFKYLRDKGTAILFSTHITTDLEECADRIAYIRQGKIEACSSLSDFIAENGGGSLEEIMVAREKEDFHEKLAD